MTASGDNGEPSVLANLPRVRPQRPSARRAATRRAAADPDKRTAKAPDKRTAKPTPSRARRVDGASTKQTTTASAKPTPRDSSRRTDRARSQRTANGPSKRTPPRIASVSPTTPSVPRQGYETEDAIEPGVAVQPPSGTELATSVAELIRELAQAGLETGGRLLKDAFGQLPGL